jgi:hypothetical protein
LGKSLKAIAIHGFPTAEHLSSTFDSRKDTLEELTWDCDYFNASSSEKLGVWRKKIITLNLFCSFDNLNFLPQLKQLTTLTLDMEIYWETPYYTLPPNSLPNLTKLIFRLIVPGEQCAKHLKSKEKDVAETESFVVSLAQASPSLTVFDLHCDEECLTEKAFRTIIISCVKLEKIRFHITRDRFYYNGLRKAVNPNFSSVDHYETTLCNKVTKLQCLDLKGWKLSAVSLRMIMKKMWRSDCSSLKRPTFSQGFRRPFIRNTEFLGMLENKAFEWPARAKLYHQNVHLIFLQVNVKLFSRNEKCRFLL